MSHYYVYAYLDPREPGHFMTETVSFLYKPFYIGKGKAGRMYDHLKDARPTRKYRNTHKLNTIRQICSAGMQPFILKIEDSLTESEAVRVEEMLIKHLKEAYGLTNIRTSAWILGKSDVKKHKKFNNPRKNTITIYNNLLGEHAIIKNDQLSLFEEIYGKDNIVNTSVIPTRIGEQQSKARFGCSNGMYGKSVVKGKRWCIVNDEEKFLSPEDIDKYVDLQYNVIYGRKYKPSGKRVIFEGELKGKYRTDEDISNCPNKKYQYGLVWNSTKPTFINHTQI